LVKIYMSISKKEQAKRFDEIKNDQPLSEVNPTLAALFRPSVVPFLKSVISINPSAEMSLLEKPTLILGGKCDVQVPPEHAVKLQSMKPDAQLIIIDNMGHVMKTLEDDCSNAMTAYGDPAIPLNEILVDTIVGFINQQ